MTLCVESDVTRTACVLFSSVLFTGQVGHYSCLCMQISTSLFPSEPLAPWPFRHCVSKQQNKLPCDTVYLVTCRCPQNDDSISRYILVCSEDVQCPIYRRMPSMCGHRFVPVVYVQCTTTTASCEILCITCIYS